MKPLVYNALEKIWAEFFFKNEVGEMKMSSAPFSAYELPFDQKEGNVNW